MLDGRLVALDANSGKVAWQTTTVDQTQPFTITGAPRIAKGKVIIGNGGAEYGVRGYVSAYDAETGKLAWRFYTVPGDPSKPQENKALEKALPTWKGTEWFKVGGGGTVWDSIVYDPELNLLYVGTGNGSPWNRDLRSPGGGDNLYLCSILAINPDNGELVWHYQTTPADTWDYTSVQPMMLADLNWAGRQRKVIMQAPKNGFFYVLDRATGELLAADPYVEVNWATHVDLKTGRPVEVPGAAYKDKGTYIRPGPLGGHNWQAMSFSPRTGLVYIPAQDNGRYYEQPKDFMFTPNQYNLGVAPIGRNMDRYDIPYKGRLLAWDPVARKPRWTVEYGNYWNGGTLATAGNLVFQGTAAGDFIAYRATDGTKLWSSWAGTGIVAPPITYMIDGKQYVSVMAGWGGAFSKKARSYGRLLTFAIGGYGGVADRGRGRAPSPRSRTAARRSRSPPARRSSTPTARAATAARRFFPTCVDRRPASTPGSKRFSTARWPIAACRALRSSTRPPSPSCAPICWTSAGSWRLRSNPEGRQRHSVARVPPARRAPASAPRQWGLRRRGSRPSTMRPVVHRRRSRTGSGRPFSTVGALKFTLGAMATNVVSCCFN